MGWLMIVGYHVIFGAYGFWLPNDPRGSWSQFVGSWELFRAGGKATKTTETRSVAHRPHDRAGRLATKQSLARPAATFTPEQVLSISRGFASYVVKSDLPVWACAIMPDHIHIVFGRDRLDPRQVVNKLKGAATTRLVQDGTHPFQEEKPLAGAPPKCFATGEWVVFLDPDDIARSVAYVENNPVKDGLPRQVWDFVRPRAC